MTTRVGVSTEQIPNSIDDLRLIESEIFVT